MKVQLLTCLITVVYGDGYGNDIAKVTISVSGPISCFGFMSKYFPMCCQDKQDCNTSFTCGLTGRAALSGDETCAMPVATQDRISGSTLSSPRHAVLALFISKLHAAFQVQLQSHVHDVCTVGTLLTILDLG